MAGFGRFKVIAVDHRMPRPSPSGRARHVHGKLSTAACWSAAASI